MAHKLVLAFDDESASFVHGFEAGRIWQRLSDRTELNFTNTIHAENKNIVNNMAIVKDYIVTFEDLGDGWVTAKFRAE